MTPLWLVKLRALFSRRSPVADLDDELDAELELIVDDYIEQGCSPEEARQRAIRRLGFEPSRLLVARFNFPNGAYEKPSERDVYFRRALEQVRAVPGIVMAGQAAGGPMGGYETDLERPDHAVLKTSRASITFCDAEYQRVIGATLQARQAALAVGCDRRAEGDRH
jgi:hypothetical protein